MAYYNDPQDDELSQQNQAQTGPQSSVITGTPGAASGSQTQSPTSTPDKSGNFVGLQTYLNANKPQAAKLGDQASGIVTNSINDARNSVTGLNNEFNQSVDKATEKEDPNIINTIGSGAEGLTAGQKEQAKRQYGASYGGPNALSDLQNYQNTLNKTNLAAQNVQSTNSEAGRMGLVNQINSAPRTRGDTLFDNMLLQKGPGRDKLLDISAQNQDVKNLLPQSQTAAQGAVQNAKDTTAKTQNDIYKAVQDALGAWQSGFTPKLAAAQDTGLQSRLTADLGGLGAGDPYLDDETISQLGQINPHDSYYKLNLQDYLNPFNPADVSAGNVASPEDYARYGALSDIAGNQDPYLNQANVGKAGTAPKFSVDQQRLGKDLQSSKDKYTSDYKTMKGLGTGVAPDGGNYGFVPELATATPEEIEKKWIPWLRANGGQDATVADNLARKLDTFSKERGFNNKILSNLDKSGSTSDGKIHAWI